MKFDDHIIQMYLDKMLSHACVIGRFDLVKHLIKEGADPTDMYVDAAFYGNWDIAEYLKPFQSEESKLANIKWRAKQKGLL